jgi:hypothetical protein
VPVSNDPAELLTAQGQELLARLAADGDAAASPLALAERLRRDYPADLVALAMAQRELRKAAAAKFSRAARMLFTRAGYEQSSSEAIARHRARRLAAAAAADSAPDGSAGAGRLADLCCGIGGDLIALAAEAEVLAVDRDATHARLAGYNAAVYDEADRVTTMVADVRDVSLVGIDAVFIDPARRSGPGTASAADTKRFRAGLSEPPLDWCAELTEKVAAVCVKAAPGIPEELIPPGWEAEFIAESRDLKEAVLWSPALAVASSRATILTAAAPGRPVSADILLPHPGDPVPLRAPGEYLLDPNPAVTRAGLVEELARRLGAWKLDPRIAFLTADAPLRSPFGRLLRVDASLPWNLKQLRQLLRQRRVGAVEVRKRGSAVDVGELTTRLRLHGEERAVVVLTRVAGRPWALVCTEPPALA